MSKTADTTTTEMQSTVHHTDLTAFEFNILLAAADLRNDPAQSYGLAIKRRLEEINHGRLYPNLDSLVEADLLDKSELDKRTNLYELTDEGEAVLEARRQGLANALGVENADTEGK